MIKPNAKQIATIFSCAKDGLRDAIRSAEDEFIRQKALGNANAAADEQERAEALRECLEIAKELDIMAHDNALDELMAKFKKKMTNK